MYLALAAVLGVIWGVGLRVHPQPAARGFMSC